MIGIKEFNKKISSLKSTSKMTKTMKMVSASKLKRAHKAQAAAMDYANKLQGLIARLFKGSTKASHPLVKQKTAPSKVLVLIFTSDKGLCGGFNNNLIRKMRYWIRDNNQKYSMIQMSFCGRRGYMAFRRNAQVKTYYEDFTNKPEFSKALKIANEIAEGFILNEFDEVYIAYNKFVSPLVQIPTIEKLLPLDPAALLDKQQEVAKADYEFEPEESEFINFVIPKFMNFKIYFTLLENAAGEHGARMSAMDKATQNTADLIDRYTLLRNRARQATITTELIEIISGAEALK